MVVLVPLAPKRVAKLEAAAKNLGSRKALVELVPVVLVLHYG